MKIQLTKEQVLRPPGRISGIERVTAFLGRWTPKAFAFSEAEIVAGTKLTVQEVQHALVVLEHLHMVTSVLADDGNVYFCLQLAYVEQTLEDLVREGEVVVTMDQNGLHRYQVADVQ